MAVRGSPAKGVGWGNWREGSNPSFSATKEHSKECSFAYSMLIATIALVQIPRIDPSGKFLFRHNQNFDRDRRHILF